MITHSEDSEDELAQTGNHASEEDIRKACTLEIRIYTAKRNGYTYKPRSGTSLIEKEDKPLDVANEQNVKGGLHSAGLSPSQEHHFEGTRWEDWDHVEPLDRPLACFQFIQRPEAYIKNVLRYGRAQIQKRSREPSCVGFTEVKRQKRTDVAEPTQERTRAKGKGKAAAPASASSGTLSSVASPASTSCIDVDAPVAGSSRPVLDTAARNDMIRENKALHQDHEDAVAELQLKLEMRQRQAAMRRLQKEIEDLERQSREDRSA
ncbi:unnamed protein product [Peniophora sp. CBMAI 1063]|nr:unnamed protein product [Peniophora sp. CBMAI 1063]